jgi:hypothetical protein
MAPTPTITPWLGMSRGTDCTVPMVPGLVSVTLPPAKSSGLSLFDRTLRIISSYEPQKPRKSWVSASRITGTSSVRLPSDFSTSTASPRLTCWWRTIRGLPTASVVNVEPITGMESAIARTTA